MDIKFDYSVVDRILDEIGSEPRYTIAILQALQEHYRYLPKEIFPYLANKIGSSEATIYVPTSGAPHLP